MNVKVRTYKETRTGKITLYSDGSCRRSYVCDLHIREVINKMACYNPDFGSNVCAELYTETSDRGFLPAAKLYVASECKTGRDTFRNSGYSITRMPDKADAIVVPDVRADLFYNCSCNMISYDTEKEHLYLWEVEKAGYLTTTLTLDDLAHIRKYLRDDCGHEPQESECSNIDVWFIPKCQELVDVMEGNKVKCGSTVLPYIQESKIPIKASTTISPETLVFWENIDDTNLLMRTICTSDWMDYPITILAFLTLKRRKDNGNYNWYTVSNQDFRRILKQVGYQDYYDPGYLFQDRDISPKDYDMLQGYLFFRMGIDQNGGIVTRKMLETIPNYLRDVLKSATAFKRYSIPTPMRLESIGGLASL